MRKHLKKYIDQKFKFQAEFKRYGLKSNYIGGDTATMLLLDVKTSPKVNEEIFLEHFWANVGKTLARKNIREGAKISFNAWIRDYKKGYVNLKQGINEQRKDFTLKRLSKIKIISEGKGISFNQFIQKMKDSNKFITNLYENL